ncbi:MAG TPA: YmfQ family protein [Candidatus Agathobaculum merdavium]|nr:YmfQ family protein [Candidatus Agathobaculum merdavium]
MQTYDDMLQSLPVAYRRDAWVIALLGAVQAVDNGQRDAAREAADQLFLDSMTYVLPVEERIAGLTPGTGDTVEERRSVLQAKWRSATGICNVDMIQRVCDAWENGEVEVDYQPGEIVLRFVGAYGVPTAQALAALQAAVLEVIPAHLAVQYLYRYLLVREVHGMTINELQSHTLHDFAF